MVRLFPVIQRPLSGHAGPCARWRRVMKIEPTPPSRPCLTRQAGAPRAAPRATAPRSDDSFHSPDDMRVDIVMAADPDSHEGPDHGGANDGDMDGDDETTISRETALKTARALGYWLADHALSLTSHRAARLQHLFAS